MKKALLLSMCILGAATAFAQTDLVKGVERQMKSGKEDYYKLLNDLKPAMSNAETADQPYVWFVAGKGGMDYFDHQQAMMNIGQEVKRAPMSHALIDGYTYLLESLKRDSIPNEKGKVKPKYSKDIMKLISGHHNDYNNAAIYLYEEQDYDGAYDAWQLYLDIPNEPLLREFAPKAQPDSILCDIAYNQALAAWQGEHLDKALESFNKAIGYGYNKKNVYDYAISIAYMMHDTGKMAEYAAMAYPMYGKDDNHYIGYMINDKIANKQYDEARQMLESYIQDDPENAQLYYILGVLYDSQEMPNEAVENYKKAIALDDTNAQAYMQLGRQICNRAYVRDDEAANLPADQYNNIRLNEVNVLFREGVQYLEKAYQLDPENMDDALRLLRNCYYNLNDEDNLKRIDRILGIAD